VRTGCWQGGGVKVGRRQRSALYAVSALLWSTGAAYWLLERAAAGEELGAASAAWRPRLLALHGAGAVLFLVILGTLLPHHVRRAWRAGANRWSGAVAIGTGAVLTTTGWLLYYAGDEGVRAVAIAVHDLVGLALPLALLLHVARGRAWRRRLLDARAGRR